MIFVFSVEKVPIFIVRECSVRATWLCQTSTEYRTFS